MQLKLFSFFLKNDAFNRIFFSYKHVVPDITHYILKLITNNSVLVPKELEYKDISNSDYSHFGNHCRFLKTNTVPAIKISSTAPLFSCIAACVTVLCWNIEAENFFGMN